MPKRFVGLRIKVDTPGVLADLRPCSYILLFWGVLNSLLLVLPILIRPCHHGPTLSLSLHLSICRSFGEFSISLSSFSSSFSSTTSSSSTFSSFTTWPNVKRKSPVKNEKSDFVPFTATATAAASAATTFLQTQQLLCRNVATITMKRVRRLAENRR